jgi:hypothetical protein
MRVAGGVISLSIPSFLQAFNHLSPIKYAIGNMAPYTLRDQHFTCEAWQRLPTGNCPIETGQQVLELYHLVRDPERQIMALGICTAVYRVLAWVCVKAVKERWVGRALKWGLRGRQRAAGAET